MTDDRIVSSCTMYKIFPKQCAQVPGRLRTSYPQSNVSHCLAIGRQVIHKGPNSQNQTHAILLHDSGLEWPRASYLTKIVICRILMNMETKMLQIQITENDKRAYKAALALRGVTIRQDIRAHIKRVAGEVAQFGANEVSSE